MTLAPRQREDGPGRGPADARQPLHRLDRVREPPAEFVNDCSRGLVQVAGPRVVAESRPQVQHLVDRRGSQRGDVGETLHEPLEVRDDRGHLGLLQHDLGHPHAIRRGVALPGQVPAPVLHEPRKQSRRDFGGDLRGAHGVRTCCALRSTFSNMRRVPSSSVRCMAERTSQRGIQNAGSKTLR